MELMYRNVAPADVVIQFGDFSREEATRFMMAAGVNVNVGAATLVSSGPSPGEGPTQDKASSQASPQTNEGQTPEGRGQASSSRSSNPWGRPDEQAPAANVTDLDVGQCLHIFSAEQRADAGAAGLLERNYVARGMYNSGNSCFLNSVLQVLLACDDFRVFLDQISDLHFPDSAPVLQAFSHFASSYASVAAPPLSAAQPLSRSAAQPHAGGGRNPKAMFPEMFGPVAQRFCAQTSCAPSSNGSASGADSSQGLSFAQQDAQEFLLHLTDQLHEEMIMLRDGWRGSVPAADMGSSACMPGGEEEWAEVGKKNRSAVTRRHLALVSERRQSRMTHMFSGQLRSTVRHSGSKASASIEPFTILQLDITQCRESEHLADTIARFTAVEYLEDYRSEGVASKLVQIEKCPRILTIQFLRFTYDQHGRSRKLAHSIRIPDHLAIRRESLSPSGQQSAAEYELFACISHRGVSIESGHYTAEVKRAGKWLRLDDDRVRQVRAADAKGPDVYLLFYKRAHV